MMRSVPMRSLWLNPPPKKKRIAKVGPKKLCTGESKYVPMEYREKRFSFIQKLRDGGTSFADARQQWDESGTKKELLAGVPVGELIRRRFVPKGTKENPWD